MAISRAGVAAIFAVASVSMAAKCPGQEQFEQIIDNLSQPPATDTTNPGTDSDVNPDKDPVVDVPPVEPPAPLSLAELLQDADAAKGRKVFLNYCSSCHGSAEHKSAGSLAPNLYDILAAPQGRSEKFNYSSAFRAANTGTWTYDNLDAWIEAPQEVAPGSRMYVGKLDAEKRADLLAYLRLQSENPQPLPVVAKAEVPAPSLASEVVPAVAPEAPEEVQEQTSAPAVTLPAKPAAPSAAPANNP